MLTVYIYIVYNDNKIYKPEKVEIVLEQRRFLEILKI